MHDFRFRSSAQNIAEPLDCRRLKINLFFYQLDEKQTLMLCNDLMRFIELLVGEEAILTWLYNGKTLNQKQIWKQLNQPFPPEGGLNTQFEGYVRSPVVYNLTTLRKYQKFLSFLNPTYSFRWNIQPSWLGSSNDYPPFIDALLPLSRPDDAVTLEKLNQIICEPDRKYISLHLERDFQGEFCAKPYEKHRGLYYGRANLSFSAFCLGDGVNLVAESLAQLAKQLSEKYVNINADIGLQPEYSCGSPYMHYFGKHIIHDGSHKDAQCSEDEWYPTYYFCGVEWLNLLSPLTRKHLPPMSATVFLESDIVMEDLSSGALLVRSSKPIAQYNRCSALALKRLILPALYPGRTSITLRGLFPWVGYERTYSWCPLHDWAVVPIEPQEMDIIGFDLVYTSMNCN